MTVARCAPDGSRTVGRPSTGTRSMSPRRIRIGSCVALTASSFVLATAGCTELQEEPADAPPALIGGGVPALPPGVELSFRTDEDVSTDSHRASDVFTAHLSRAATVGGNVVIPEGAASRWEVTRSTKNDGSGRAVLAFRLTSVRAGGAWHSVKATTTSAALDVEGGSGRAQPEIVVGTGADHAAEPFPADTPAVDERPRIRSAVAVSLPGTTLRVEEGSVVTVRLDEELSIR